LSKVAGTSFTVSVSTLSPITPFTVYFPSSIPLYANPLVQFVVLVALVGIAPFLTKRSNVAVALFPALSVISIVITFCPFLKSLFLTGKLNTPLPSSVNFVELSWKF